MRLSGICFFKQLYPGNMFRGKKRFVKKVTNLHLNNMRFEFARQERIMHYLLNPYITLEESYGHSLELKKQENKWEKVVETRRLKKVKPNITIEERLAHLTVKDAWD